MALELKINLCTQSKCSILMFSEKTGVYNALTNTTGYGSPNSLVSDINTAVLSITGPDNITYNINLFSTGNFPTSNTNFTYSIPLSSINRTIIEDGLWTFIYKISTTAGSPPTFYTVTLEKLFTCNANCCVEAQLASLTNDLISCNTCDIKAKRDAYNQSKVVLDSLNSAAMCGSTESFNNLLSILNKLCKKSICKTCN